MLVRVFTIGLIFFASLGCEPKHSPFEPGSGQGSQKLITSNFDSISKSLIASKCLRCHRTADSQNHYIDLSSYEAIINSQVFPALIAPGRPEESSFYTSMSRGRMPKSGPRVSDRELTAVYDWIKSGALLTPPDDPTDEKPPECQPGEPGCEEEEPPDCEPDEPGCGEEEEDPPECEPDEPGCGEDEDW